MKKYDLKNIKTWNSRNGYGMTAILMIDGKDVCSVMDLGDGSQPTFGVMEPTLFNELKLDIEQLQPVFVEQYGFELKLDVGLFIDLLHYALETGTEFKLLAA